MLRIYLIVFCLAIFSRPLFSEETQTDTEKAELVKKVLEISKKEASEDIAEKMKIYPNFKKYMVTMKYTSAEGDTSEPLRLIATEKYVDEKYLVSTFRYPNADFDCYMVVFYDEEKRCYVKWYYQTNIESVITSHGITQKESRTISWAGLDCPEGNVYLGLTTHTDTGTTWVGAEYQDGKLVYQSEGIAEGVKE